MSFTPYTIKPELDLELVRDVPVPPEAVFAAWTDPESLKQWFAPRPYSIAVCEIDLRPGGGFRTAMNSPDGEQLFDSTGCILDVVPNERLVWSEALTAGYRPQASPMPFTEFSNSVPTAQVAASTGRSRSTRTPQAASNTRRWDSTKAGAPSSTSWWSTSKRPGKPSRGPAAMGGVRSRPESRADGDPVRRMGHARLSRDLVPPGVKQRRVVRSRPTARPGDPDANYGR